MLKTEDSVESAFCGLGCRWRDTGPYVFPEHFRVSFRLWRAAGRGRGGRLGCGQAATEARFARAACSRRATNSRTASGLASTRTPMRTASATVRGDAPAPARRAIALASRQHGRDGLGIEGPPAFVQEALSRHGPPTTSRRLNLPHLGFLRPSALASATTSGRVSDMRFRPSHLPFAKRFRFTAASLATVGRLLELRDSPGHLPGWYRQQGTASFL